MGKRDIIQLLDYPSESEPEVEVDAPRTKRRRTSTDKLVDHPAEPIIHRHRSQATNLMSNPTTAEVDPSTTASETYDVRLSTHDTRSPAGTVNEPDMSIYSHDPPRINTEHSSTASGTHMRLSTHDVRLSTHDTRSPAGTVNEPGMSIYSHDPPRIDTEQSSTASETHMRLSTHGTRSPADTVNESDMLTPLV